MHHTVLCAAAPAELIAALTGHVEAAGVADEDYGAAGAFAHALGFDEAFVVGARGAGVPLGFAGEADFHVADGAGALWWLVPEVAYEMSGDDGRHTCLRPAVALYFLVPFLSTGWNRCGPIHFPQFFAGQRHEPTARS